MPKDVVALGRRVKNKYPGVYDDLPDGVVGQKVKAKFPGAYDDYVDAGYTPPAAAPEGAFSSFQTGVAGPLLRNVVETATDIYNRPLETLERAGRAGLEFASAFDPAGKAYQPTVESQAPRMAELRRRAEAERPETVRMMERGMQVEEAKPRTTAGRVAFGTGRVLGEVAFPTAPESAVQNVVMAPFGGAAAGVGKQVFRAGVNTVRRVFGKGAAQIIEAEALPAATSQVRPPVGEVPPIAGETSPGVQNAMRQFEQEVARIKTLPPGQQAAEMEAAIQRIGSEASGRPPVSPQSRAGYPPLMEFPENPNPIQMQAGRLPGEGPPPLSAETEPPSFGVRAAPEPSFTETTGPSASAPMDLDAAITGAGSGISREALKKIANNTLEPFRLLRSVLSSGDISAPFRQGAILTLPPSQWGKAAKAGVRMFQAFSTKKYNQIVEAIASHPAAPAADEAGLYLATRTNEGLKKTEEYFLSRYADKIPIVKQSEQAYKTYLDSLRMDTFSRYKAVIDKAGLSSEQAAQAYKAAADWINIATGRGSFGQKIDRALPVLNEILFAPRNLASRLQVLNPATYAKNAATQEGRIVLKEQMKDLVQFAGVVAGTMQLAKAAGADVSLNPNSPDFLKIKYGNFRYDPLAGLQQVMRVVYRVGAELGKRAEGEKASDPDALDIAGRFLRSKLAPVPSFFADFITGRTVTGKPFEAGKAVMERTLPLQWNDFIEAYQAEGFPGVAKSLPGAVGVGTQRYESNPVNDAIERAKPLFTELQRLNKQVPALRKRGEGDKKEPDDIFNARVKQFGQNYTQYGLQLLQNERFRNAPDDVKDKALTRLGVLSQALTTKEFGFPELELDANQIMDAVEASNQRYQERVRQRGF